MRAFPWAILIFGAALSGCGGGGQVSPPPPPPPAEPILSLLAGGPGGPGSIDGTGAAASFDAPSGVVADSAGNIYVADTNNHTIRKITPAGVVSTLAGAADVPGSADGVGTAARFTFPWSVAADDGGNVYVADSENDTIRKITPSGVVTTLAGMAGATGSTDGSGAAARFNGPLSVASDRTGNVYVADTYNSTIRKITPAGVVTTLAGSPGVSGYTDGTGAAARFASPGGLTADSAGNVYVADTGNDVIRKIAPGGVVTTLAGKAGAAGSTDGTGAAARFTAPWGVAADSSGNVYVADTYSATIRKITPAGVVTTLAGMAGMTGSVDGSGAEARFDAPQAVAAGSAGNVYVADTVNSTVRKITPAGVVSTFAGTAPVAGSSDGTGAAALFKRPHGVATDSVGNIYVADTDNNVVRKSTPAGVVTTLAGMAGTTGSTDGAGAAARFSGPSGVATDTAGNVYVADLGNYTIRKITPAGVVTTLAGSPGMEGSSDGTGAAAHFGSARSVAADSAGNLYVADQFNDTVRKITPAGAVTTLAGMVGVEGTSDGTGASARFAQPIAVAADGAGNVYVADNGNSTIRKITPSGAVTTLAGMAGVIGSADGTGSAARFDSPEGVATDSAGNVYVADTFNDVIRKITPSGAVTTIVGRPGKNGFLPGALPGLLGGPASVTLFGTTLYTTTNNAIVQVSSVP
jgi:NHL repeat